VSSNYYLILMAHVFTSNINYYYFYY